MVTAGPDDPVRSIEVPEPTREFIPSGFFCLRTPLLPWASVEPCPALRIGPSVDDNASSLPDPGEADRRPVHQLMRDLVGRPEIREAIFLASPSLESSIDRWMVDPATSRGPGIERALWRYLVRAASRPTPFGLFAGCSLGVIGDRTRLVIEGMEQYERHSRLDIELLYSLCDLVTTASATRQMLHYRPNSTLWEGARHVRLITARQNGKRRNHHLVALPARSWLSVAVARSDDSAILGDLVAALVTSGIKPERAERYVNTLVDAHVLVPDVAPTLTGPDPAGALVRELAAVPGGQTTGSLLAAADEALAALDRSGLGAAPARYRGLAGTLRTASVPVTRLVQVDLVKPAPAASLGRAAVDEILRGATVLQRVTRGAANPMVVKFRDAFVRRYERREVPLLEVLHSEVGIGAGCFREPRPLLDGLGLRSAQRDGKPTWGKREDALLARLVEVTERGDHELELSSSDLDQLTVPDPPPLPDAWAALATVAARSQPALDRGEFRVLLHGLQGPSGARLLGRFCLTDPSLRKAVMDHLAAEEALDPEAVFAEVVHLPEGRIGNVVLRPSLRSYEIPYLGRSSLPSEYQLPVSDLLVSVRSGEVILRSARLGRRVVPRLSCAHDFMWRTEGVYRFLCALQSQGVRDTLSWDWGPLQAAPFLPRVSTGRVVLARARWRISAAELRQFPPPSDRDVIRRVAAWRARRGVPGRAVLADGDNELPIDFSNPVSVESFVQLVRGREQATLIEHFPHPDELCASGPEGRFTHEVVVPVVRASPKRRKGPRIQGPPKCERTFPPGSEWLYAKVYAEPELLDGVLTDVAGPVIARALASGAADGWFFICYADPDSHLRVRIHGASERLSALVVPDLQRTVAQAMQSGLVRRLQLDTYEREVERYGGPRGVALCEGAFEADSAAVLGIIGSLGSADRGSDQRWRVTLAGMDRLLDDLGFGLDARLALMSRSRQWLADRHHVDGSVERRLGRRFRRERAGLEALLNCSGDVDRPLQPALEFLRERSERLRPVASQLARLEAERLLTLSLTEIAGSLLHMHANRLLWSTNRAEEFVLYDFLTRLYRGLIARGATTTAH
jgi:thiopeptide-type bacteriocin biosynthesis protein